MLAVYVADPAWWSTAGTVGRLAHGRSLQAFQASIDGRMLVCRGAAVDVIPRVAAELRAETVHVSAEFVPSLAERDREVERLLAADGRVLVRTGSPYAVSPGRVVKSDGTAYQVFTPFSRAWVAHGWRPPAGSPPPDLRWVRPGDSEALPDVPGPEGLRLPEAGEKAALRRWYDFRSSALPDYADARDRPDLDGSSQLSAALRWGEIHPRTLLADLGASRGESAFRTELAWREFYADVLHHSPSSAHTELRSELRSMSWDTGAAAERRWEAWASGRTGYPFVDAGMRQLRAEGWIHNRVRMVVASFLTKDLHLDWRRGAEHFLEWLRDGDLASNQLSWQWVFGSGTDAAPYVRVFNPVTQGLRFDPDGGYVRRYVPELAGIAGAAVHEPWKLPGGPSDGYPDRLVDHAEEREESLARYRALSERTWAGEAD